MKIAVYTLTRDRCRYSQECLTAFRAMAGMPFDHYIVDNGSTDDTHLWLSQVYRPFWYWPLEKNHGISRASNIALRAILSSDYDLVVKLDNDCMVRTPDILQALVKIYSDPASRDWMLGPYCDGLVNQPRRGHPAILAGYQINRAATVGGIFHVLPTKIYREFFEAGGYSLDLPLAKGQDEQIGEWLRGRGYSKGYVDELKVEHFLGTVGQCEDMNWYFQRKWKEEQEFFGSHP